MTRHTESAAAVSISTGYTFTASSIDGHFPVSIEEMRDGIPVEEATGRPNWSDLNPIPVFDGEDQHVGDLDPETGRFEMNGTAGYDPREPLSAKARGEVIAILAACGEPAAGPINDRIEAAIAAASGKDVELVYDVRLG